MREGCVGAWGSEGRAGGGGGDVGEVRAGFSPGGGYVCSSMCVTPYSE